MTRPEEVARGLTAAGQGAILALSDQWEMRPARGVNAYVPLYRIGLLEWEVRRDVWSRNLAKPRKVVFHRLTDFGKSVRRVLEEER